LTAEGQIVARVVPVKLWPTGISPEDAAILEELQQTGGELSKDWPKGVGAVDAVCEQRREL